MKESCIEGFRHLQNSIEALWNMTARLMYLTKIQKQSTITTAFTKFKINRHFFFLACSHVVKAHPPFQNQQALFFLACSHVVNPNSTSQNQYTLFFLLVVVQSRSSLRLKIQMNIFFLLVVTQSTITTAFTKCKINRHFFFGLQYMLHATCYMLYATCCILLNATCCRLLETTWDFLILLQTT